MPNWESDDNSTDDGVSGGTPHQTIDRCAACFAEVDTTGDPAPQCPLCGSKQWFQTDRLSLSGTCLYGQRDCAGPRGSVAAHICEACLDIVAVHDRVPRAAIHCMCHDCDPYSMFVRGFNLQSSKPPAPAAPKPKNPFDTDTDDWL